MSMVLKNPYADSSSLPFRFRQKRFAHVRELIDGIIAAKGSCRILDVGGETVYWNIAKDFID
ncbi:MAG: SAM-dependent methyltransferase, partial [Pseudorhodoplanes sp.]